MHSKDAPFRTFRTCLSFLRSINIVCASQPRTLHLGTLAEHLRYPREKSLLEGIPNIVRRESFSPSQQH